MNVNMSDKQEFEPVVGSAGSKAPPSPPLLFEMMRSFVTLASTLNLSHAVADLSSTRQTVRRHIATLEAIKGGALFDVRDRRYALTPLGQDILPEAQDVLAMANAWLGGQLKQVNGLEYLAHYWPGGASFHQQQHSMHRAFTSSGDMLQKVLEAWTVAGGQLDHPAMHAVRPYCNIFRRLQGTLVFAEVGEESSFVSWFGAAMARSSIGCTISKMPGGDEFARLVERAYYQIEATEAIRLDHVHTQIPKDGCDDPVPISYERLMLGARFPDDSPAIVSTVRRTYDIEIKGVSDEMLRQMPKEALM